MQYSSQIKYFFIMKIKEDVIKVVKRDKDLIFQLMKFHNRAHYTISKWLRDNDSNLLHFGSMLIVEHATGISVYDQYSDLNF